MAGPALFHPVPRVRQGPGVEIDAGEPAARPERLKIRAALPEDGQGGGVFWIDGKAAEVLQVQVTERGKLDDDMADVAGVAADPLEEPGDLVGLHQGELDEVSAIEDGGGLAPDGFAHDQQGHGKLAAGKAFGEPRVEGLRVGYQAMLVDLVAELAGETEEVELVSDEEAGMPTKPILDTIH